MKVGKGAWRVGGREVKGGETRGLWEDAGRQFSASEGESGAYKNR